MKLFVIAVLGLVLLAGQAAAAEKEMTGEKEKRSYSLGYDLGNNLKAQSVDIDFDVFARGLKDALAGNQPALADQQRREVLLDLQKEIMAKRAEAVKAIAEKNKKAGEAFLDENKKKEGVVTLPSGLQYKVIKEGTGKTPMATNAVKVNYRGTLIDGTEFDSSYKRGEPAVFEVDKVIAGWTEALQLMKEGSKWEVFIPSNLAYGERSAGPMIGPNSTLIFEIDLISIER